MREYQRCCPSPATRNFQSLIQRTDAYYVLLHAHGFCPFLDSFSLYNTCLIHRNTVQISDHFPASLAGIRWGLLSLFWWRVDLLTDLPGPRGKLRCEEQVEGKVDPDKARVWIVDGLTGMETLVPSNCTRDNLSFRFRVKARGYHCMIVPSVRCINTFIDSHVRQIFRCQIILKA